MGIRRKTKTNDDVVDVELLDNSISKGGKLAQIKVSVFGKDKIDELEASLGDPMAFFNLSVVCAGRGNPPVMNHYNS